VRQTGGHGCAWAAIARSCRRCRRRRLHRRADSDGADCGDVVAVSLTRWSMAALAVLMPLERTCPQRDRTVDLRRRWPNLRIVPDMLLCGAGRDRPAGEEGECVLWREK